MVDFVIGVDVHKRTHTFVAVDTSGRKLCEKTVDATPDGHRLALRWAKKRCVGARLWGLEDVRNLSSHLETELLEAGEEVVRVPTKLTARQRASARTRGKSDPIDALAIARVVLREDDLPQATLDQYSRTMKLLVDRRDDLVVIRTATVNRLLDRLHQIDPVQFHTPLVMHNSKHRNRVAELLETHTGLQAELASDELAEIDDLTIKANVLKNRITKLLRTGAPALMALDGCGPLSAAKIVGEVGDLARFSSEAKFASYVGVTPIPDWSGSSMGQLRSGKSGNRQLNRAMHTVAMGQIRLKGAGDLYYRRRRSEGDSHSQAVRRLKRQLCRAVYRSLTADVAHRANDGGDILRPTL